MKLFRFSIVATIGGVLIVVGFTTALLIMLRIARAEREEKRARKVSR